MSNEWTSNSEDCLAGLTGRTITGYYYAQRSDICGGIVLVLDDGTGIRFSDNGSYWRVGADDVQRECARLRYSWEAASAEARRLARLAGVAVEAR